MPDKDKAPDIDAFDVPEPGHLRKHLPPPPSVKSVVIGAPDDVEVEGGFDEAEDAPDARLMFEPVVAQDNTMAVALRAEVDRMVACRFNERLNLSDNPSKDQILLAFEDYDNQYHPDLFATVHDSTVSALAQQIHGLAVEAKEALLAMVEPAAPAKPTPEEGRIAFQLGIEALAGGHNQEATGFMGRALLADPQEVNYQVGGHLAWAALFKQYGKADQARDRYQQALALQPDNEVAHEGLATLKGWRG